jgi:glycosyltransferase involved in cell wall biosynthesis
MSLSSVLLDTRQRPAHPAQTVELSVIIPAFNVARLIGDQLDALASQDWHGSWELIVADNGSSDDTVAVAEGYRSRLPDLRVVDASGLRGSAHARNCGAQEARGESLLFVDADDIVTPGFLKAMVEALHEHPFIAPRIEARSLNTTWAAQLGEHPQHAGLMRYYNEPFLYHASGCGIAMRRSLFMELGGFDPAMIRLQDSDFCFRAQLAGIPLHFVPEATVAMRNRTTFKGMLRQAYDWGSAEVELARRYRSLRGPGHVAYLWARYTARWPKLLVRLLGARSRLALARIAKEAARQAGIFRGALSTRQPPV